MAKRKSAKPKSAKSAPKEPKHYHVYRVAYLHNGSESSVHVLAEDAARAAAHLKSYNEPAVLAGVSEVVQDVKIPSGVVASPKPKLIKAEKPPKAAKKPRTKPSKKPRKKAAAKLSLQDSNGKDGQ
jgi:hypothetical protein